MANLPDSAGNRQSDGETQRLEGIDRSVTVPVIAEQLDIAIVQHDTGVVRVRKVVHQADQTIDVGGTRTVVETRRVPVGRAVDSTQQPYHRDDHVLVVPVYEERLVRQIFLVEEVHVTTFREAFTQEATVALRREAAVVERFDTATQQWVTESGAAA